MIQRHAGLWVLLLFGWSSSNFVHTIAGSMLLGGQTVDVSVVYQRLSLRRFVVTRTLTMAISGERTPSQRVVSPSLHPVAWVNKRPSSLYRVASCLHVRWVQMGGRTIDFDRESASSIEQAQVMRRAANIVPEMQGTSCMDYSAHYLSLL